MLAEDSGRGFGIADLARTAPGEEPRAGGPLAYHVLEVMGSLLDSAHSGKAVAIASTVERPPAVGLAEIAWAEVTSSYAANSETGGWPRALSIRAIASSARGTEPKTSRCRAVSAT